MSHRVFYTMRHQVAIFDLDETLWNGKELYENTIEILEFLQTNGAHLYIASFHLEAPLVCDELKITKYFSKILYGRDITKSAMIQQILSEHKNIDPKDVIFFDDNIKNIYDVETTTKIDTVHVTDGLNWSHIPIYMVTPMEIEFPEFFNDTLFTIYPV